jgi:hypothetical protein
VILLSGGGDRCYGGGRREWKGKNFTYENTTFEGKLSPALRDMFTIEYEEFGGRE